MASMIICPECPNTFRTESGLNWHLEHIHGRSEEDAVTDNPFQYPLCNCTAESGPAMVRHVMFAHDKSMSEAMSLCGVEHQEIVDEAMTEWLGKGQDLE